MSPKYFCPNPFDWLDVAISWGDYSTVRFGICSLCWATDEAVLGSVPVDNLPSLEFDALWNSQRMQKIRWEMLATGVPAMCVGCPRLKEADHFAEGPPLPIEKVDNPRLLKIIADRQLTTVGPKIISLAYDPSCNLACPSCRTKHIHVGPGDPLYDHLKAFQDKTIRPMLRNAEWVFFSSYGDPFGSVLYMDLLRTLTPEECPDLKLSLLTNGLGFTPAVYASIPLRDRIEVVQFSMDAATPETHAKLRGGDWYRLMANCNFVANLRCDGKVKRSEWGFVFQSANWRELPAFLDMAKAYRVDKVMVYTLLNHAMGDDYGSHAIHHPDHPDHAEAMRVLDAAREYSPVEVYVELPKASSTTA